MSIAEIIRVNFTSVVPAYLAQWFGVKIVDVEKICPPIFPAGFLCNVRSPNV